MVVRRPLDYATDSRQLLCPITEINGEMVRDSARDLRCRMWGIAVHEAGAGPRPISHLHLTPETLAAAITFALAPAVREAAQALGKECHEEDGTRQGVASFHRHLPLLNMRSVALAKHSKKADEQMPGGPIAQSAVVVGHALHAPVGRSRGRPRGGAVSQLASVPASPSCDV